MKFISSTGVSVFKFIRTTALQSSSTVTGVQQCILQVHQQYSTSQSTVQYTSAFKYSIGVQSSISSVECRSFCLQVQHECRCTAFKFSTTAIQPIRQQHFISQLLPEGDLQPTAVLADFLININVPSAQLAGSILLMTSSSRSRIIAATSSPADSIVPHLISSIHNRDCAE